MPVYLSKLPSGLWRVAVKHRGRRATGSATTKTEARLLGAQLLAELGGNVSKRKSTVADVLAATDQRDVWSPTYTAEVDATLERLPDVFLERSAATISPAIIRSLYRSLDVSPHRLRRVHEVLAAAYARAVKLELVDSNPFARVDKPAKPRRSLVIPDHGDVSAILNVVDGIDRLALRLSATVGMRRGELVAIQWADIDMDRATLVVRRSLSYAPSSGVRVGATKTGEAGHRVVALDLPTVAMLRKERAAQVERAVRSSLPPPVWVFSHHVGVNHDEVHPWRPDYVTHLFARARKKAGVTGVRLHDLRHYVATTMLEDGEAPHDVANQLGHASTATTLAVYAHHLPGRGRESVNRRAARLDEKSG